jgi:Domain of unknown function (DUF1707)
MAQRSTLRASDEDRDRVAERLHRAATEGRLVAEELEQRLATALRARTYGELDSVVADLPGDRPSRGSRNAPATRRRLAPSPLMLAGLVVAIPVIVAAAIAAMVVLMTVIVMWAVLAIVTWRVFGGHGIPGPWTYARRRGRAVRYLRGSRRNAVGGSVPWL